MLKKWILLSLSMAMFSLLNACGQDAEPLIVYAGKGLKFPMEDIKERFEQQTGLRLSINYAGSQTLLSTIRKTRIGDIFIPGSSAYIKEAGDLVARSYFVAPHVPVFAVASEKRGTLRSYADLLKPGVKIAVGNRDMAAIGRVTEGILKNTRPEQSFQSNIMVTASTVNELLSLVASAKVDAALVWKDMLTWEMAKDLASIAIPAEQNSVKDIFVGVLSTSANPDDSLRFAEFVSTEGKTIFAQHGFVTE